MEARAVREARAHVSVDRAEPVMRLTVDTGDALRVAYAVVFTDGKGDAEAVSVIVDVGKEYGAISK